MDPMAKKFERYRRHGDLRALGEVFDALAPRLLPVAMHLCGNPADAEDALQEAFVLAMRRAETFDPKRRLGPWLVGFLTNTARSAARRERRRMTEGLPELASGDEGPMAAAEREELVAALRTRVDELPSEQRQVLMLQLQHGLAPAEIAEVLEVPAGTVRMRLHRGLAALRRLLPAGFAAWLFGALPSRGLAAVRQAVLQVGKEQAVAAGTAVAAVGSVLAMKKLIFGGFAMLLFGLLWLWPTPLSDSPSPAKGNADASVNLQAQLAASTERTADAAGAPAESERSVAVALVGSLRVRVHANVPDEDGGARITLPVGGALVQVWPGEQGLMPFHGVIHNPSTDAAGEVTLRDLSPGTWQVLLAADLDATSVPVTIEPDSEALVELEQPAVRCARGTVVDADGRPVPGAELWVYRGSAMGRYGLPDRAELSSRLAGLCDAEGRFAVPVMWWERSIGASHHALGQSSGRYVGSRDGFDRRELRLVLGRESASVSGTVRDPSGQPCANALVTLRPPRQDDRRTADGTLLTARAERTTRTDAEGRFALSGLVPGKQQVWAHHPPHTPAKCDLDLAAFAQAEVRLDLTDGMVIVGTVRHGDGTPAAVGVEARPVASRGGGHYNSCPVRADGSYVLDRLPRRSLFVVVHARGQVMAERHFVDPPAGLIQCDFILDGTTTIHGRLMTVEGAALTNWWVVAKDQKGREAGRLTNADGTFRLGVAADATLEVVAFPSNGDPAHPAVARSAVRADGQPIELRVPAEAMPRAAVHGRLVGPDGRGLAKMEVVLSPANGVKWHSDFTTRSAASAADGRFTIEELCAGAFSLGLGRLGAPLELAPAALSHGQQLDLGDLLVQPDAVLQVEVTRPDGSPWSGALPTVALRKLSGQYADVDGSFAEGLLRMQVAAGTYRVVVESTDLIAAPQLVELQPGQVRSLRLPVAIGRSRRFVFNADGKNKPQHRDLLHVTVQVAGGEVLLQRDLADLSPDLRGFRYWSMDHSFPVGRYEVEAATDNGLHYRAAFEVRDNLDDPTRIEVPLVGQ